MYYHLRNGLLIVLGLILSGLILYILDINSQRLSLVKKGTNLSFTTVLQNDLKNKSANLQTTFKELPFLVQEASQANGGIRQKNLENIAQALDMYYSDNGEYPETLKELISKYLKYLPDSKGYPLEYEKTNGGYILKHTLPSGEVITRTP